LNDNNRGKAYELALDFPGYGETYGTKLLRFLDPKNCGALDSRIKKPKGNYNPPIDLSGDKKDAYLRYLQYLQEIRDRLNGDLDQYRIPPDIQLYSVNSTGAWCAAHVEMALFAYATRERGKK
jgi:hypothetical protein